MRSVFSTLLCLTGLLLVDSGRAATVTTTDDDGPGSLREAIANAAEGETIDFSTSGTITLTSGELWINKNLIISGPGADNLLIQRSTDTGTPNFRIFNIFSGVVTISGLTVSNGRDDVGGGINNQSDLTLNDSVVTGNSATESGGGIFNTSTLVGSNCVVRGNSALGESWDGFGGGIYTLGTLQMINSTISSNSITSSAAGAFGGGICNDGTMDLVHSVVKDNSAVGSQDGTGGFGGGINNGFGTMYVSETTVSGNFARGGAGGSGLGEGGGVDNGFGTLTLERCTVSGNFATGGNAGGLGEGGGVANDFGTVYLDISTVSGNVSSGSIGTVGGGIFNDSGSAILTYSSIASNVVSGGFLDDGGGIFNVWGSVEFKSSIIVANLGTVDFYNGEFGLTVSHGSSLIGSTSGFFVPEAGDQFISAAALKLGPLQDNGGPTFTHALLCGSPAIDAGNNTDAPATDQRGFARIVGGVIDIGAYETANTPPTVSCPSPITLDCAPPSGATATVSVTVADAEGDPLVVVWTVDGTAHQTNVVAAAGPPTTEQIGLTTLFSIGSHQLTVSVSDPSGCLATCSTTVEVVAFVPPTVSCPTVPDAGADQDCQAAVPNVLTNVTVNAECASGEMTLTQSPAAGTLLGLGTHTITVTATDEEGNSAECTTSFTVTDTTAPTVVCPAVPSASADGNCQAAVPNVAASVSDNCTAASEITITQSPAAGTLVGPGMHTITVTATDAAGNSASCTTSFTVTDTTAPTVVCPAVPSASADGNCQAAVPNVAANATDNCSAAGAITITQSPAAGTLVGSGMHTITVTATDAAGNSATCTTSFTVTDTTAPTVVCPAVPSASADGNCQAAVPNVAANATDNCSAAGAITITQSPAAGTLVGLGAHTITVTATDAAGNSASCTTSFTVTDTTAPTVVCPAVPSASADGNCQAAVPNVAASVSDNCSAASEITISQSPAAGTLVGPGMHTITVTATDAAGNSATCTTSFTVTDTTAPTVVCPAVPSASADGNCQAAVPNVAASVSDNCSAAGAITITQSPAAGTLVGLGTHTITVTATDAAGNSATCTTSFTVTDTTAPTVVCPAVPSASADGNCQAAVPNVAASVSDNCSAAGAITITQSPAAGTLVGLGTHTITVTATDAAGNSATCTTSFTVTDTTAPTVVCPAVPSASADGNCQAAVPNVAASVSDNCSAAGAITITQSPAAGTLVGLGTHTITVTATDAAGNSAICTTSFTVTDATAPTVVCPAVPSASADANCQAAVPNVAANATDNCSAAGAITITQSPAAGTLVGLGTHTITVTATDAAGNSASCTTSFTVTDDTAPSVVCPTVPDASADANCQAAIPTVAASVSDNCTAADAITITQSPAAGTLVGLGTNTITVTATDAAGNTATCTTTFTVTGNATVTVACPAATSASADANCQAAVPNVLDGVTMSGGCNGTNGFTLSQSPAAGTLVGLGAHTITVTATDATGNSATCATSFTVTDTTAPTVNCPADSSASADSNCQAPVPNVAASVSDNCTAADAITITQSPAAGTLVGLGTHTITVTATDAAGNSASCTTTLTVTDTTAPTVVCPAVPSASADGNCQAAVPDVAASVSDNCSAASAITITQSPAAGTLAGLGTHTITVTATDAAGNSASCTTSFTVTDTTAPTVVCPAVPSASADANCQAAVPTVAASVSDNCSAAGAITITQSPAAGTLVGLGAHTITVTATDAAGNSASCTTSFTVADTTAPTVVCPAVPSASADGNCQAAVPNVAASVSDNCTAAGAITITQSPAAGTLVGLGTHSITVTATDAAGNSASCTTSFTVTDDTAPSVVCPTVPDASADANCQAPVPNVAASVSDNCTAAGEITITQSPAAGTLVGLGTNTITVTATDAAGNTATCTTTFTVTGNATMTVACPAATSASADANCQAAMPNVLDGVTMSGGCNGTNGVTMSQSPAAGTLMGLGTHTITVTATDATGNTATCTTTFTVTDDTAPSVICPTLPSAGANANCQAAVPAVAATVSDNCTAANAITLTQTPTAGTLVGLGAHTITVTATDAAGNSSSCMTTFTVTDNTPPTVSCPAATSASAAANCQAPVPNVLSGVTASDNCSAVTLTQSPTAGTLVGLGAHTITVTATDAAGNSSSCTTTFTVTDNTPPTVSCPAATSASAAANCQAPVPNVLSGVTASDNCSAVTLTQSPTAGTLVGLGTHTITVTATDAAGNSASCTTTFTVIDDTPPTVVCPAPTTGSLGANCQAAIPNILSGVTASDNCTAANAITLTQSPVAGTLVGSGPHTITVTATDAAGNSATCTTTFTVTGSGAAIHIIKLTNGTDNDSPTGPHVLVDSVVTWTYLVTNPGCESLQNVAVTDSVAGVIPALQSGDANLNGRLDPGETWTYSASGKAVYCQYENIGTATGTGTVSGTSVTSSNPDHYFGDPTPCPSGSFVYNIDPATGDLLIKFYQFPAPNDNSYGANAVGWPLPRGHTFKDQVNSDHAGFQLRNPSGQVKLDFWVDYMTEDPGSTPSGYRSLGPFGGDGRVVTGTLTANDIVCDSSLARNLNNLGYFVNGVQTAATKNGTNGADLLLDSPPTLDKISNYTLKTPNPWTNGWDFADSYFVTIKKAKLDSLGFNIATWHVEADTVGLHNSPAKPCPSGPPPCDASLSTQVTPATGGDAIPADGAVSGVFTTLTGPIYTEDAAAQVTTGTIILNAPAGFVFDTGGTAPSVATAKSTGGSGNLLQGSVTSRTSTQITYTVTSVSTVATKLTWQNIRVRPTSGTPLVDSYLTRSGTAALPGVAAGASFGDLTEIAGAASRLAMLQQPSTTAMAGVAFDQQPSVAILDQFGNVRSVANGVVDSPTSTEERSVVTAVRLAGSGNLQGSTSVAAADGVVGFTDLFHNVATNITIQFTLSGVTPVTSDAVAVGAGPLSAVGFRTQPGNATAGSPFGTQPVLQTQDAFGNPTTAGLPASLPVTVSLTSGTGTLQGTTTVDIGSSAGNGTAVFSNLRIDSASTAKQLTASATGLTSAVSAAFTVNASSAASLAIQTQPPTTATAGAAFSTATVVRIQDAFGNLVTTGSPVVTATRNAGTASLQGTTSVTATNGAATFSNLSYTKAESLTIDFTSGTLSGVTSASVTVNPAAASKLTIQTQPSASANAGAAFAQQPVIRIEDAYGNLRSSDNSTVVTVARSAGSGTLQGTLTATAVNGVVSFANLSHNLANTISLSFTASGLTGATSSNIVVSPGAFAKLQLLVPGETAAPGTASGKTGTPTSSTAGTAFNITVNAVDNFWNVVNTVTDMVDMSSTDANATLPADTALVSGTKTLSVTFKVAGSQTLTASDVTNVTKTANTSPSMTVNAGAFVKLQLLAPGETAAPGTATGKTGTPTAQSAGTAFNVTVNAVDANWNVVSSTHTVAITTTDANDTHPASAAMTAGTKTFAVTFKSAGSWTVTATDSTDATKTANTSPSITANAGAFAKLQILVPGENAAPGGSTGKTGTPTAQAAGTPFNVTVNAVDANWNPLTTVTDTVGITTSDANAILPANSALVAGTQSFSITLRTTGSSTLTAADLSDGTKTANTSSSVTVNAGPFVKMQVLVPGETAAPGTASGKTGTPTAQTAGTAFNVTIRSVDAAWNLVTNSTHTVGITSSDSAAVLPANGALAAGTRTASLTLKTTGSQTVTATDITDGTKTANTSPAITVNAGAASKLTIQTQPSTTATAGAAFAQQPVIRVEDAYGNLRSSDNSTVVTVSRSAGSGTLQGTLTATAVNGVATFANLSHNLANTITLSFTASGLTSATSGNVVVNPAAFAKLQLLVPGETAAPATASGKTGTPTAQTAATAFNITVNAVDSFWNVVSTVTDMVDISSTDANATLPADTALVSGTKTLSVTFKTASTQTLTATDVTDGSKSASTSPSMTVNAGAFVKLQLLAPGEAAAAGTATGKTGTPTAQTAGTAFNVTVNAVDANWNIVSSTHTVGVTTTDANDTHPANAAMSAGTRTFAVTFKSAGSWTITASNITDATKTASTSPAITANVGAFAKLQILVPGETAAPGSSTGKTGTPTAQTSGTPFNVTVSAVDANWNPVTSVIDAVAISSSDANAVLPANTALVAGAQTFSVTFKTAGSRTVTVNDLTDGTKTANTSPSITVNAGAFVKLQVLVPGETAAPGTATGKTGMPSATTSGTAFNATINAVDANWNVASSTHTVGITSSDSTATLPANGALAAGTRTASVTLNAVGTHTVMATDITDGTKTANTSPSITVNVGPASKLTIQTQPSTTATAGAAFAQQPVIRIEDANGNLRASDNSTVVTVARSAGSGTLQGTLTATAVNGIATFADLSHNVANTITLNFTASGLTNATSGNIVVSPAAFTKLQLLVPGETAAPGTASGKTGTPTASTAATAFNVTVNAVDNFWNVINTVTDLVEVSSTDANATLPANAALVSGAKTLSVTFKTAGSQTLTATDVTNNSKTANTSPSMTVNAGAFVKLQLLVPGETAAPGSATGKTGTPTAQNSGAAFNVTVNAVDANWNVVSSTHTVGITTTDANDTHPANAAMTAGTRTFALTFKSVGNWTITASDITDATKTANTSPSISVNVGAFAKMQILLPGETAAPGSATGKTGTPTAQTSGTPFNVTVNAVDANWNMVTNVTDTVGIAASDANAVLPGNAALVAGTRTFSVNLKTVGSRTVTATDITDGSKTANTSSSVTVNAGAFVKLQLLVPGETAAPGTASGKTGTPSAMASGTPYNVTINSVDANWNLVSSTHTVGITSSDSSATLPSNGALVAGTRTASVTLRTLGSQTVTAADITDGTKTANTSPAITVNVGTANKLTIQTQPSSTASAGDVFAQQPVIRVEDASGNVVTSDNGRVITVARSAGTGTLQGTLTATTVNGIATFVNLSHNVANTITLSFTASGLTSATSGNIAVSPDTATQLLFTTQPASLRTGSPLATQPVVKAVDQFGNASSTGMPANFNVSLALTSGSGSLLGTTTLDIGSAAGNGIATFTNVECSDAGTNKQITASSAGFTNVTSSTFTLYGVERAMGGTAISSSTAGGTYTTLTGPVYYEYVMGDIGTGTIILNAPAGFVFDTGGTAPTVKVTRLSGGGNDGKNINGVASGSSAAITSRTTTQITFTVSTATSGDVTCSLTWQNIRVRPSAATPLASGNVTKTGTSVMATVTNSSTSFGRLIEIGPAAKLTIQTQPSSTATAGVAFAQQPVIRIEDAAGNFLTADNTTVVTATRTSGSGTLQGTTSRTAVNGLVTFTNLAHNVATNITITFSSGTLTNATSTAIAVSPAAASQLAFTTQPANGTYGATLATQPVLRSRDQFGNDSTIGLGANKDVTVSLSAGTGPLLGTTTLDIGTSAGNGVISFTNLRIDSAGTDKQFTASASGMSSATSSVFTVAKANQTISFGALAARTYGDAPFTVTASASSALPVSFSIVSGPATMSGNTVTITGAGTVTVRASQSGDANWNAAASVDQSFAVAQKTVTGTITASSKTYDGTTAATIATRTLSGVIGADNLSLSGGTATFANKTVGNGKTITATGLSLSGTAAGNYQLASTSATATADITAKGLTVSGVTANNKVYDNTTTATLNFGSAALVGVVSGDAVTLNTSSAAGAFADENVGTAKTVTVSGLSLSGADAGNYTLTQPSTTASITTHGLTVTGITADNKVYDGTNAATLNLSSAMLVGVASGDAVTLETGSATATFADANVGTAKAVTVSGLSLSGVDAANYALVQPSATADITAATVTGSITADNKIYDGTSAATIATRTISGVIGSDNVSLSGGTATFDDKNAGSGKTVTATGLSLSGADAGNYQLASTSASTTAAITARPLTVSATGVNKIYDATTLATVSLSDNRVSGDDLTTSYMMASFASANVGTGKTVSVTGIVVTGTDEDNYTANMSAITTADITPATLTGSITAENKIYDGTTAAAIASRTLSALEGSDDVSLVGGTATFADKNVGSGKSVTATGLSLAGPDAANYQLASTSAATTADITPATLTVSVTANSKPYDGTMAATIASRNLSGVLGSDDVSLVGGTATFADKSVGTGKSVTATGLDLSGADAGNYQLASTSAATSADIAARSLTLSATGENKIYDGTTAATVTLSDNRVSGDDLTASYTTASYADKNVGTGKTVSVSGISVSGTDAANYTVSTTAGTAADITARALTVSASGVNKVYDGTTAATVTLLDDRIEGDELTVSYTTASFADNGVQNGKLVSVSGITVSGTDAGNYAANTEASTVADITGATLTVVGIVAENKAYDGTTVATLNLDGAEAIGLVSGDDVTVDASGVAGAFSDAEVGTGKLVTVSGLTLIGADAGKYTLTQPTTTADITAQ